jgi:iron-sulfur cluster repair protein YtfE (RIC family)
MAHSCSCGCQGVVSIVNGPGRSRVTADDTVGEVAGRSARARDVALELGFDLCCGSGLTLRQAAAARGLPIDAVLRALDTALA